MGSSAGWQSATSFTNEVSGTASSNPIAPHNQLQNNMPTVAATGPMSTREPINFGISRFADSRCRETTVSAMIKNGPAVLNWSVAASRGTTLAKTTPKKGIKFKNPLAIPRATAPSILIASNAPMVTAAISDPTIRLPPANPRTMRLTWLTNLGTSVVVTNVVHSQS